jgi:hypothetical protein
VLTDTGRHRAVTNLPTTVEPVRRRHAADAVPSSHPDARPRGRSRAPQRILAGTTLVAIALAPVLARSNSGLGLHDAVAAELAAHPGQTEDTLEALSRGGILAGSVTPTPAPGSSAASSTSQSTSSPDGSARRGAGSATAPSSSGSTVTDTTTPTNGSTGTPLSTAVTGGSAPGTTGGQSSATQPQVVNQAGAGSGTAGPTPTGSGPANSASPSSAQPSAPETTAAPPAEGDTGTPGSTDPADLTTVVPETTGGLVEADIEPLVPTAGG